MILALKVADKDNVATIFAEGVKARDEIEIRDKKGGTEFVEARDDIPYGHKIAVYPISKGEDIIKYGERIGVASMDIQAGSHVHIHNLDSMRGRGDLGAKEERA